MPSFMTPEPITLTVRFASGDLQVVAEDRDSTEIEVAPSNPSSAADVEHAAGTAVEQRGDQIIVVAPDTTKWFGKTPKLDVRASVPTRSALTVVVESADTRLTGPFGDLEIKSASGDVRFEHAAALVAATASGDIWGNVVVGDATVKSASGDVRVSEIGGTGELTSASGDLLVTTVGRDARIKTASGDAVLGSVGGSASARTASGDVRLGSVRQGTVEIDSASGDVSIGVEPGTAAWLEVQSLSGDVASELETSDSPTDDEPSVTIRARTLSGDIVVRRAGSQ